MNDVVKIKEVGWGERKNLPALQQCLVQALDAKGEVELMGFTGGYADRSIWDVLQASGDLAAPGAFRARLWRIDKEDQAAVARKLAKLAKGWPTLTLGCDGHITSDPGRSGEKPVTRAEKTAVLGVCGKAAFQIFDSRTPGAQEFASAASPQLLYKFEKSTVGAGDTLMRAGHPVLPGEISAAAGSAILSLPVPTALVRRRGGWAMELILVGDSLAVAAAMAATDMPSSRGGMVSANSFPLVEWPTWRAWMQTAGIVWTAEEGFNPDSLWDAVQFDEVSIPGWNSPTEAGFKLREFQKEGVRFVMSRKGRALLADDMGLGKTAQAIATASAMKSQRTMILSPAAVKSVWVDEIKKWCGAGAAIQTLEGSHDRPARDVQWLVASYDQVVARAETWRAAGDAEFKIAEAAIEATIGFAEGIDEDDLRPSVDGQKIKFSQPLPSDAVDSVSRELSPGSAQKWNKLHSRLRGELLRALQDWEPDLLVLDEAHRVKSADAKRTVAAISLSASAGGCLAMSGTPIQNNTNEPAVLLHVINPGAYHEVRQEKISVERIKALLRPVMLRRIKAEVLKELPPVTEQVVRISLQMDGEDKVLDDIITAGQEMDAKGVKPSPWADGAAPIIKHIALAWSSGKKLAQFEVVRAGMGREKASTAAAIDFILDALENKGCLVVFTAHHDASDAVAASIRKAGWRVEVADGRTSLPRRAQMVADFQGERLDCLVCGMEAMGEGVTLHRADTVVFLELAYKHSTLGQARDRLHRIGQKNNVQAIYLVSDHPLDTFLGMMVLGKAALVGDVLSERVSVLGEHRGAAAPPSAGSEPASGATPASNGEPASRATPASNGENLTPPNRTPTRQKLSDEDRAARTKESKRKWKAAHPEKRTDSSRALAAARIKRWREKNGDEYRAKQREYVHAARERKKDAQKN